MTLQIELSLRGAERRSNLNVRLDDRSHPFASHRQHSLCEIGSTDGGANEPIRGLEANFCTGVDNHNYFHMVCTGGENYQGKARAGRRGCCLDNHKIAKLA
jgi:hypothetical protein